ncbi:MAG TPA: hypothetical protein VF815_25220 [Myxococcaceae bacterium]|jgi:hypothetical protein
MRQLSLVEVPRSLPPLTKDERFTQLTDFLPWHMELPHTLDVAGCPEAPVSRLIGRWCGRGGIAKDGLTFPWDGEMVWCNPPFSHLWAWVAKAWASRAIVDMLLPATRTEQSFWQQLVEPYRDRPGGVLRCRFLTNRLRFGTPEDPAGVSFDTSPPFGCVRLTWLTSARPPHACPEVLR